MDEKLFHTKLEVHETKNTQDDHVNGSLTVIWRNWDKIIEDNIKMIYVSSVNPYETKGPHLHKKRNSHFTCIHGKVVFVIKKPDGKYVEIESSEENPIMVSIPKGYPSAHINLSSKISRVLALADVSWKPNDDEMENVDFSDYDWKKWNK
jgi:dTDP-4-dehydrorhamnose 3,5-epimerase|tara:strand:+ start:646 stop:1095 length:450 start_codon:yes stop_codon:yes gene_type:complete